MDKSKINMIIVALLLAVGVWWFFIKADAAPALEQTKDACNARGGEWTEAVTDDAGTTDVDETAPGSCKEKEQINNNHLDYKKGLTIVSPFFID